MQTTERYTHRWWMIERDTLWVCVCLRREEKGKDRKEEK